MNLENLTVVLPCHSLEDLSLNRSSAEAEQILSAWSAFYHPALLAHFKGPPGWRGAVNAPNPPTGHLLVIPPCCVDDLPDGWLHVAADAEAVVIRQFATRSEVVSAALAAIDHGQPEECLPDLVPDFFALGYCHLLVELLTRQLRYMSNLDEVAFESSTLSAARKWAEGDADTAREHLTSAFDLLTEAREYFYPVETYLLDFTLVAPTTIGPALVEEISGDGPTNLVLSASTLATIDRQALDTMAAIRSAVEGGKAAIVGGEYEELQLPLAAPETVLEQFRRGRETYQRLLGLAPQIFARRRFGLSPFLPQILGNLGFTGACHFTLDDGRFPSGNQSRIRWEGVSAAAMDSLVRLPYDASRASTFLSLAEKLGDAMDLDHAATAVFAHWPGSQSPWYNDLIRACSYSPVLGRFFSIDEYFKDTKYVGQATRHLADTYRSPFLRQDVQSGEAEPVSKWQGAAAAEATGKALQSFHAMAASIEGTAGEPADCIEAALERIRQGLSPDAQAAGPGCLVANPLTFARKIWVEISDWPKLPPTGGLISLAAEQGDSKWAVVNVPGMGFAWIDPDMPADGPEGKPAKKRRRWFRAKEASEAPPMAEECTLRNDFFEAKVDPITGALRSIHDYRTRDNRLAMQLAHRRPPASRSSDQWDEDPETLYTIMAADEVEVRAAGPLIGELFVAGRLVQRDGTTIARYEQTLRARRSSRILEVDVTLDPESLPDGDPWTTYYAARFAWNDATADIHRGIGTATLASESPQLEAPYMVDIHSEKINTTVLTGGLPYHRRYGMRKLDTLLLVAGESQRRFRLGIGIDLPYPYAAATEFQAPDAVLAGVGPGPSVRSGWLYHLNARNVVATSWEPIVVDGHFTGIRARLAETENRAAELSLQCFRPASAARKVNFLGEQLAELAVDGDRVTVPMKGHEWCQVEIEFRL